MTFKTHNRKFAAEGVALVGLAGFLYFGLGYLHAFNEDLGWVAVCAVLYNACSKYFDRVAKADVEEETEDDFLNRHFDNVSRNGCMVYPGSGVDFDDPKLKWIKIPKDPNFPNIDGWKADGPIYTGKGYNRDEALEEEEE